MKLAWYRFLDSFQSFVRKTHKEIASKRKFGPDWKNCVRPGRVYSRVQFSPIGFGHGEIDIATTPALHAEYLIRPEPGWEWWCPNCHDYSIITESMMPEILAEWDEMVDGMRRFADSKGKLNSFKAPEKPTPATAGCPNCKFRPGAPE